MLVLVLDTSSAAVTAAIAQVEPTVASVTIVAERVTIDARAHGELLAPSIQACMAQAQISISDLDSVVAGVGPGPFTGLRVGIVTATVLSELLAIPSYGVCSLDGIAGALDEKDLLVAADARRREVYWARYRDGARQSDPQVMKPADLLAQLRSEAPADLPVMTGAGARLYEEVLGLSLRELDYPRADALARRAYERIVSGAPTETLTPLYLRRPDAVEPAQVAKTQ